MVKIYFDKQIFSYLFKKEEDKYTALLEKIYANTENFLFFYSDAHLQDLCKDKTECKYKELEFMKSVVGNNCLSYDPIKKRPMVYTVEPINAFDKYKDVDNFDLFANIDSESLTDEQRSILRNIEDIVDKSLRGELTDGFLRTRIPLTENGETDIKSAIESARLLQKTFAEDSKFYRRIRKTVVDNYNEEKLVSTNGDLSFNESMRNSAIGMSFIEYVNGLIIQSGMTNFGDAEFYTIAYGSLDLFGISKDKKVVYRNMVTDAKHSYFASLCDCFVCLDKGCVEKTKLLYKLFNFSTKVYDIDEFIEELDKSIQLANRCVYCNFNDIMNDYRNGAILHHEEQDGIIADDVQVSKPYFGYFDYMRKGEIGGIETVILSKNPNAAQGVISSNELRLVIDRLEKIIGMDSYNIGRMTKEELTTLLTSGQWKGRVWDFLDCTITLAILDYPNGISLIIQLKKLKKDES